MFIVIIAVLQIHNSFKINKAYKKNRFNHNNKLNSVIYFTFYYTKTNLNKLKQT